MCFSFAKTLVGLAKTHTMALNTQEPRGYLHHFRGRDPDGLAKYRTPADLYAEKRREARLQRIGFEVMRVIWDEVINDPLGLVARIRARLALAWRAIRLST